MGEGRCFFKDECNLNKLAFILFQKSYKLNVDFNSWILITSIYFFFSSQSTQYVISTKICLSDDLSIFDQTAQLLYSELIHHTITVSPSFPWTAPGLQLSQTGMPRQTHYSETWDLLKRLLKSFSSMMLNSGLRLPHSNVFLLSRKKMVAWWFQQPLPVLSPFVCTSNLCFSKDLDTHILLELSHIVSGPLSLF